MKKKGNLKNSGFASCKMKAVLSTAVVLAGLVGSAVGASAASNLVVEGESYFKATSTSTSVVTDANLSGGQGLCVSTSAEGVPKNGITLLYNVQSPSNAVYNMYITCPTIGAGWISPCEIKINNGEYENLSKKNYTMIEQNIAPSYANLFNKYSLGTVSLKQGINKIYIKVTEPRPSDGRIFQYIDCLEFENLPWEAYDLEAGDELMISEEKELVKPAIIFPFADKESHLLTYELVDYFGNVVKEDSVTLTNVSKYEIPLDSGLGRGHYTVRVSTDGSEEKKEFYFSVVMDSEKREGTTNGHYMIDAPLANGSFISTQYIPAYINSLRLAGVPSIRERFSLSRFSTEAGVYDFDSLNKWNKVYEENGVHVMNVANSYPAYLKGKSPYYLTDLLEVYKYTIASKKTFGKNYDNEAWNEPDSAKDSPDHLAAYVKAKTIAEIDSGVESIHIGPGFYSSSTLGNDRMKTPEVFAQNDAIDYLDVWSYHAHQSGAGASTNLVQYKTAKKSIIDYYTGILDRYGYTGKKQIYNTEGGTTIKNDGDENVESQKFQARYAVTAMIDSVMTGSDKHYFFFYPYYNENGSLWGMFSQDNVPHSAYNSIAALTYVMADTDHVGEIEIDDAHCYIFNKKEQQLAVIYSEKEKEVKINSNADKGTLVDMMGNEKEISSSGGTFTITSGPDVQYLIIDSTFSNVTKNALPEKDIKPLDLSEEDRVIVVHHYSDNCTYTVAGSGSGEYLISDDNDITVTVEVTNFNDRTMSGNIVGTTFAGLELDATEKPVSVGPYSTEEVVFTLKQTEKLVTNANIPVRFEAVFNDKKTTKSVSYVKKEKEQVVELAGTVADFDDPANWRKNIGTTGGKTEIENAGEGVIRFVHTFGEGDPWAYPYFTMTDRMAETAIGVYFEVYFEEKVPSCVFRVFAHEQNGSSYLSGKFDSSGFQPNTWNKVYFPISTFDYNGGATDYTFALEPEEIAKLQVGINGRQADLSTYDFKIRNLGYYEGEVNSVKSKVSNLQANVSSENCTITADVFNNTVGVDFDETVIIVDGEEMNVNYANDKVSVTTTLASGEHTAIVRAFDLSGRNVGYEEIQFTVN